MSADLPAGIAFPDYAKSKPKLKWQLPFAGAWPTAVALLEGGRRLAAGNQAGDLFVWNIDDATAGDGASFGDEVKPGGDRQAPGRLPVRQLIGHTNGITRLVAAPDGRTLYSASLDHTVRVWQPDASATGKAEASFEPLRLASDANRGGKAPPPLRASVDTLSAAAVLNGHDDWASALAVSRDGRRLISGDFGSRVIVWDAASHKEVIRWSGRPWNWIVAAALSPDGETALVSEFRYKRDDFDVPAAALRVWNVADAAERLDLLKIEFPKFNPTASTYDAAQVWRKFTGDGLVAADVSPDGKLLALGQGGETDTGKVHLFDAATGKLLRTVSGHRYGVTDVRFSGDGRYVLSVGRDTMLRICDASSGKEVAALGASRGGQFKDWLSALAVSPDGRTLAAADIAGLVHVWTV